MFENYKDVLTVAEARAALRIGKNKIYALINSGQLKSYTIGKIHYIPKAYLIEFVTNEP